jgi:hypothetical protein
VPAAVNEAFVTAMIKIEARVVRACAFASESREPPVIIISSAARSEIIKLGQKCPVLDFQTES